MTAAVRRARLRGVKEAERLLRVLEARERLPATNERVDIYGALAWLDVRVIFKPLEGLVGAYIRGETPGVMISTRRPPSVQRFTAAHEFGHALLGHAPSLDSPGVLSDAASGRPRPLISGFASYLQEVEADAFAGAFLLPAWLVTRHARRQGWTRAMLRTAAPAYQLSLRCGASLQAVVWALERHHVISAADRDGLLRIRPREIKSDLGHRKPDADAHNDAWLLSERDVGLELEVAVGDTLSVVDGGDARAVRSPLAEVLEPLPPVERSGCSARFLVARGGATSISMQSNALPPAGGAIGIMAVDRERGLSRANRARLAVKSPEAGLGRAA